MKTKKPTPKRNVSVQSVHRDMLPHLQADATIQTVVLEDIVRI